MWQLVMQQVSVLLLQKVVLQLVKMHLVVVVLQLVIITLRLVRDLDVELLVVPVIYSWDLMQQCKLLMERRILELVKELYLM